MKRNKILLATAAFSCMLLGAPQAQAQTQANESGWYLGGSVGRSTIKPRLENIGVAMTGTQDTHDTAYKLVGGYQFNSNWAAELHYVDQGKYNYNEAQGHIAARESGFALSGLGMYPVGGGFSVLGKLGLAYMTFKGEAVRTTTNTTWSAKTSKTVPLLGFGAEYALSPQLRLRAEYEYYGVPTVLTSGNQRIKLRTDMVSVGLRYMF